jgi:ABC-type transport system involved in multi-copper enzyme maturation permease subunit
MSWILLAVLVGLTVLLYLLLFAISRLTIPGATPREMVTLQNLLGLRLAIPFELFILTSFGAVLAVILTASTVGNEYNWRTIRIALISSESRLRFLSAKLISAIILILIGMFAGLITGFVMSLITTAVGGNPFDFSFITSSYLWSQFLQFWRTFFMILPFTMLGFLFAVIGRSAMPGIAIGVGVLFLEPLITAFMRLAGGWISNIPDYLFSANVNAINSLNALPGRFLGGAGGGGGGPGGGGFSGSIGLTPSVDHAFIILSIYIVVFVAAGFYLFHKRDVAG